VLPLTRMQTPTTNLGWKIDKYSNNYTSSSFTWLTFPHYNNLWCTIEHSDDSPRFVLRNVADKDFNVLENLCLSKNSIKDSRLCASFRAPMIGFKYMNEPVVSQTTRRFQLKFSSGHDLESCVASLQKHIPCNPAIVKPPSSTPTPSSVLASAGPSLPHLLPLSYSQSSQASISTSLTGGSQYYHERPTAQPWRHASRMDAPIDESSEMVCSQHQSSRQFSFAYAPSDDVLTTWIEETIGDPLFPAFVKKIENLWATRFLNEQT